jgi:hypothetical protein
VREVLGAKSRSLIFYTSILTVYGEGLGDEDGCAWGVRILCLRDSFHGDEGRPNNE